MRRYIDILEEILRLDEAAHRVTTWSGHTTTVLENPTRKQFENFVAQYQALRGLLSRDGETVWLWPAGSAVHVNMMDELGLPRSTDCISYMLGQWSGPVGYSNLDTYSPAIERLTPKPKPKWTDRDDELLRILDDPDGLLDDEPDTLTESTFIAYHGGSPDITSFYPWTHFGTLRAARQRLRDRSPDGAIHEVELHIDNPLRVTDAEASDEATLLNAIAAGRYPQLDVGLARREGVARALEQAGYDGLVYRNGMEDVGRDSWVILRPEQARIRLEETAHQGENQWGDYTVYVDPTVEEFLKATHGSEHGALRALINAEGHLVVWNAGAALHYQVDEMGLISRATGIVIWPDHTDTNRWPVDWVKAAMKKNATLVKLGIPSMRFVK